MNTSGYFPLVIITVSLLHDHTQSQTYTFIPLPDSVSQCRNLIADLSFRQDATK